MLCPFCHKHLETVQRIFILCDGIYNLQQECFSWFSPEFVTVLLGSLEGLYWVSISFGTSTFQMQVWMTIWGAIILLFCIWHKRNGFIFRNDTVDFTAVLDDIKFTIWSWLHNKWLCFVFLIYWFQLVLLVIQYLHLLLIQISSNQYGLLWDNSLYFLVLQVSVLIHMLFVADLKEKTIKINKLIIFH